MKQTLKTCIDLTRAHFCLAWPLLFCSGLMLAFANYGCFSWSLTLRAALIGLLGFEAGFVLNDYVDRELDARDVEHDRLTRYWRPLTRQRPIPSGRLPARRVLWLFVALVALTSALIATLPFPNALYVFAIMVYAYTLEYFYQVKKRNQRFPWAQLVGRTDFALFPVAGYLCYGKPDATALLYFVFFYPWTIAHLGVNDIIDVKNDQARGMKAITILYGTRGTLLWIAAFTLLHIGVAPLFLAGLGGVALTGILIGFALLVLANAVLVTVKSQRAGLIALPMFHVSMVVYAAAIVLDYALNAACLV